MCKLYSLASKYVRNLSRVYRRDSSSSSSSSTHKCVSPRVFGRGKSLVASGENKAELRAKRRDKETRFSISFPYWKGITRAIHLNFLPLVVATVLWIDMIEKSGRGQPGFPLANYITITATSVTMEFHESLSKLFPFTLIGFPMKFSFSTKCPS